MCCSSPMTWKWARAVSYTHLDRIRGGEEIALAEFTAGEDEITRQVIEYGGLFPFNVARMQGKVFLPPIEEAGKSARSTRAMTLAEKIFARHMINGKGEVGVSAVKPGDTGFAQADLRFSHEYVTPMAAIFFERYVGKDAKVNDASVSYTHLDVYKRQPMVLVALTQLLV